MKTYIRYFLFWLLTMALLRAIFLAYNLKQAIALPTDDIFNGFVYGLRADLSVTGYVLLFPTLLIAISQLGLKSISQKSFNLFNYFTFGILSIAYPLDMMLYPHWGFRLDTTPFPYLLHPQEATASNTWWEAVLFLSLVAASFGTMFFFYSKYLKRDFHAVFNPQKGKLLSFLLYLCLTASLIIPIRGGLQLIPFKPSSVFFSKNVFANHVAMNPLWSLGYSIEQVSPSSQIYRFHEDADQVLAQIMEYNQNDTFRLLKQTRPDITLIIVESLTSSLVEVVGGEPNITPNINRLSKEGVLFSNCYASGDRTEKGMAAIMSGLPTLPTSSWFFYPNKIPKYEGIGKDLKKAGYQTAFYGGFEADFANTKAYLLTQGFDKIIEKSDFGNKTYGTKWGAYDHYVLDKTAYDRLPGGGPSFKVVLTLSSHEPFDVPMKTVIHGNSKSDLFRNSMVYADSSIGAFVENCKHGGNWDNSLIIIVGDHGHRLPLELLNHDFRKFQIPLILLGGALKRKGEVYREIVHQPDIAPTIMRELGLPFDHYKFGKPFSPNNKTPFAFYAYNNGFGVVKKEGEYMTYDLNTKQMMAEKGNVGEMKKQGEALLQILSQGLRD